MALTDKTPLLDAPGAGADNGRWDSLTWAGDLREDDDPPGTGSVAASVMNLSACAFGASMLSLPYTMQVAGPLPALAFLAGLAVLSAYASLVIIRAGRRSRATTYYEIVTAYFGTTAGRVSELMILFCLFIAAVSYIVGLADILPQVIPATAAVSRNPRVVITVLAVFPLTLVSNLASFGPSSAAACGGVYLQAFALLLAVLMGGAGPTMVEDVEAELPQFHPVALLTVLPMITFVYAYHYVLTDTLMELKKPTVQRMTNVVVGTTATLFGCYIIVAISGYLLMDGRNIPDNILAGLGTGSPIVALAQWSISLLLFVTYSLFIIPLRRRIEDMVFGEMTDSVDARRIAVASGIAATVLVTSVALRNLGLANAVAGGCIALIMFLFPGLLALRMAVRAAADGESARGRVPRSEVGYVADGVHMSRWPLGSVLALGLAMVLFGAVVFYYGLASAFQ